MAASPEQTRATLSLVSNQGAIEVAGVVASLQGSTADVARDALLYAVPQIILPYSDGTSALAADWYEDVRETSPARGSFSAEPVVALRDEKVRRTILWAVEPLYRGDADPAEVISRLAPAVQKEIARPFRDTITSNSRRDPESVGWRRVSSGGCKFCQMLAGRGEVYKKSTARFASHTNCNCSAQPVFHGEAGEEAKVHQYVASKRTRTDKERQQLRDYLRGEPKEGSTFTKAVQARANQPVGSKAKTLSGFDAMSRSQVEKQISILNGLKDSEYRTTQLARLSERLTAL